MIKRGDLVRFIPKEKLGSPNFDLDIDLLPKAIRVKYHYGEEIRLRILRRDRPLPFYWSYDIIRFEKIDNAMTQFLNSDFVYD